MPAVIETDALAKAMHGFFGALRPPPNVPPSTFAEQTIHLDETLTATPGRMKLLPYQKAMLDIMTEPGIERVTFKKSARLGMSTVIQAAVAHFIENDPCPVLCVLPRESDARTFAVALERLFDASPMLAGMLAYQRNDTENRSNLLTRYIPGGSTLRLVGANAPANLRAVTARVLFADEVSAFGTTVEGDPMALATMRTASFPNRLIVACSTPTDELTCGITALYDQSDKRVWQVPCQHCGEHWQIQWGDMRWTDGDPDTAHVVCPSCGGIHSEADKLEMVLHGRWHATAPEVKGHAGFHINSLASLLPSARWPTLVREFLKAKQDTALLQAFVNTVLGETWREQSDGDIDPASLEARREPFGEDDLPPEVLALTAGVDVQRDRLERTIMGHTENGVPVIIDHTVLWGDPLQDEVWRDLQDDLKRTFPHPGGGKLPIMGAALDAGDGGTMAAVINFAGPHWRRHWYAIKGMGGTGRLPFDLPRKSKGKARLAIIGVDTVKTEVIRAYSKPEGEAGAMRFSDRLDGDWFDQLTAERRVVRMKAGRPVIAFEQVKKRNEALDCAGYALAVWHFLKPRVNWDRQREQAIATAEPAKCKKPSWQDNLAALGNL
ncbi:phage terminase large subunit GpA-like protein [Hoeflea halophila]|uniref:Phage terminase large subunit GpA-like protein n=1 Tax=Hoeflea halophila TaxID=714899 RepID=A0A286IHK8_9HYPH|nr:terminase gpA endonuclease subunit [Hoeflea halophila]SOE18844.1 phage terminase large subunit GpA-like protein [Hoeflea halophila]